MSGLNPALVALLLASWPGTYDLTQERLYSRAPELTQPAGSQVRLQSVVAQVPLPWLGPAVLYAEEFAHDEPEDVRRQALLVLSAVDGVAGAATLRVQWYALRDSVAWRHLHRSAVLLSRLTQADIEAAPGCDVLLTRASARFVGGTQGKNCAAGDSQHYIELKLAVGAGLFWSHRRIYDRVDDELIDDLATFTYAGIDDAQLFRCQVYVRDSQQAFASLDIHDQGGREPFRSPDGRAWELVLYGRDWPTANGSGALQLSLEEQNTGTERASGWAAGPRREVALDGDGFRVSCAPFVPVDDRLLS